MTGLPPRSTRTGTLFPCPTLFRSADRKGSEAAYTRRIRKVNRDLEALQEGAYLAWWGQAFDMLAMEGRGPGVEEMPAWMASDTRSGEHTSELQSLMRNSYAVFC